MKKICIFVLLFVPACIACSSVKVVPSPDASRQSCVLAYDIGFASRTVLGSIFNSDSDTTVRYVRAERMLGGKAVPDSKVTTDIISGQSVFFAGVVPGEYVITDLVYAVKIGSASRSSTNRISIADSAVRLIVAVVPEADRMKTSAKAEAGKVCYAGSFALRADGSLRDLIPDFDEQKKKLKAIVVDKGYAPSRNGADDVLPVTAVKALGFEHTAGTFRKNAAVILSGSGWENAAVKDLK